MHGASVKATDLRAGAALVIAGLMAEGRTEITLDADGKVMSYRDSEGKKHEHDMEVTNLDVSNLNLKGNSVNNIKDALKANGFDVKTPIDWSESSFIQIPEPRFAIFQNAIKGKAWITPTPSLISTSDA